MCDRNCRTAHRTFLAHATAVGSACTAACFSCTAICSTIRSSCCIPPPPSLPNLFPLPLVLLLLLPLPRCGLQRLNLMLLLQESLLLLQLPQQLRPQGSCCQDLQGGWASPAQLFKLLQAEQCADICPGVQECCQLAPGVKAAPEGNVQWGCALRVRPAGRRKQRARQATLQCIFRLRCFQTEAPRTQGEYASA